MKKYITECFNTLLQTLTNYISELLIKFGLKSLSDWDVIFNKNFSNGRQKSDTNTKKKYQKNKFAKSKLMYTKNINGKESKKWMISSFYGCFYDFAEYFECVFFFWQFLLFIHIYMLYLEGKWSKCSWSKRRVMRQNFSSPIL